MPVFFEVIKIPNTQAVHFFKDDPLQTSSFFRWDFKCILKQSVYHLCEASPPNKRAAAQGGETTREATQLCWGQAGVRLRLSDVREGRDWEFCMWLRKWVHGSYFTNVFYKSLTSIRLTQVLWNPETQKHVVQKFPSQEISSQTSLRCCARVAVGEC